MSTNIWLYTPKDKGLRKWGIKDDVDISVLIFNLCKGGCGSFHGLPQAVFTAIIRNTRLILCSTQEQVSCSMSFIFNFLHSPTLFGNDALLIPFRVQGLCFSLSFLWFTSSKPKCIPFSLVCSSFYTTVVFSFNYCMISQNRCGFYLI